jgi:hypothetical protein
MNRNSKAEAMRFAIAVLPAPEVPTTTTRIWRFARLYE